MISPALKHKRSAVKNIVRFPAIKANGGKTILVNSILVSKYCLHLEFDPNVVTYFPQPKTFKISDEDGEITYSPDFEVHYVLGMRSLVVVNSLERYKSIHNQQLFDRFESTLHDPNFNFSVVDELEIYKQPLLSNYEKLYQYRKRPTLDMRNLNNCVAGITKPMPLSRLFATLGERVSLREIYSWLALGFLRFNMSAESLNMTTEVTFDVN
mgnify:CR=1 FL=1